MTSVIWFVFLACCGLGSCCLGSASWRSMIARAWSARASSQNLEAYKSHLSCNVFPGLCSIPGFCARSSSFALLLINFRLSLLLFRGVYLESMPLLIRTAKSRLLFPQAPHFSPITTAASATTGFSRPHKRFRFRAFPTFRSTPTEKSHQSPSYSQSHPPAAQALPCSRGSLWKTHRLESCIDLQRESSPPRLFRQ